MKTEKSTGAFNQKMFGLAMQALVVLSVNADTCPSCEIAQHLKSEATQLRRILAKLVRENILETREGRDGGYRLKRPPEAITLADVYIALQVGEPLCTGIMVTTGDHPFGMTMNTVFGGIKSEVDRAVLDVLKRYTIADLAEQMHKA